MNQIDNKRLQALRIMTAQGADTEKKITAMSIDDIVMIDKIRTEDIKLIRLLQKEIKNRNVIGFLTHGTDEEKEDSDADDDTGRGTDGSEESGTDRSGQSGQSDEPTGYGYAGAGTGSDPGLY